jgi:hypothetical protein
MMKREVKGVVHNSFYKRNNRGDTSEAFWGRNQGYNMKAFEYKENKEGKVVIVKREY